MTTPALVPQAEVVAPGMIDSLLKNVGWTPRPSEILRESTDEASVLRVHQQAADSVVDPCMQRPLDIALVHAADQGGGAERSVLTLHQTLRRLGHRSRLFVGEKQTDEPEVYEIRRERPIPGVLRVTRWLENEMGWQNLYAPWFRELHRQIGAADVLHIHTLWGGTFGYSDLTGLVRLSQRYPTVMTLRDAWMLTGHCACPIDCNRWKIGCGRCPDLERAPAIPRDATRFNWKRKRRYVSRSRLQVTTVSNWLKEVVEDSPIFVGQPVEVVHNGIDESIFCQGDRRQSRRQLGLSDEGHVLLLVMKGNPTVNQGIEVDAVQAVNGLARTDVTVLLVGKGSNVLQSRFQCPVVCVGEVKTESDMSACYRAASLTIVPSEFETFGRVPVESQMCGTPVVAYATGGLTDAVGEGIGGMLCPPRDVEALRRILELLLSDPARLAEMGRDGALWARRHFTADGITRKFIDLYRRTIAGRTSVRT